MTPPLALVGQPAPAGSMALIAGPAKADHGVLAGQGALIHRATAPPGKAALFVDLAGVLLDATPTPGQPAGLRPGAGAALRLLDRLDYRIVVLAPCALDRRAATQLLPARVADLLSRERVPMAGFCCCACHTAPCTDCPPADHLLQRAAQEYGIVLASSWLLARGAQHLAAGQRAGCRTVLIDGADDAGRGWASQSGAETCQSAWTARDIVDAALAIIRLDGTG